MPFIDSLAESERKMMEGFWKVNPRPPGMQIDPGGRIWSEFIGMSIGIPRFFVSQKVLDDLSDEGIKPWRITEMPIATIRAKILLRTPPPKYCVLEAAPGISVWGKNIPQTFKFDSWNGSDLFSIQEGSPLHLFCTERVKHLAEKKGWTNAKFDEIALV